MQKRHAYCIVSISPVRHEGKDQSEITTQLLFGELVEVSEITAPWAHITSLADGYSGYIDHKHIRMLSEKELRRWVDDQTVLTANFTSLETPWGTQLISAGSFIGYDSPDFNIGNDHFKITNPTSTQEKSIVEYANEYINVPYLWGGKSFFGIDCSGLTQMIYRFKNYKLPRDASEQVHEGSTVDFQDRLPGDMAFFHNSKGKITHVGIIDQHLDIIHASGHVRRDNLAESGILHMETGELTHHLNVIKRL